MRDFFFYKNLSVNLENIIFFNIYIYSFPSFKTAIQPRPKLQVTYKNCLHSIFVGIIDYLQHTFTPLTPLTIVHSLIFVFVFAKKQVTLQWIVHILVIALCSHTNIRCTVTEKSQPEGTFSGSHSREENINTT